MNASVEAEPVSFESEALDTAEPTLEVACENKVGFTALCASCYLVKLFGDCPKTIRENTEDDEPILTPINTSLLEVETLPDLLAVNDVIEEVTARVPNQLHQDSALESEVEQLKTIAEPDIKSEQPIHTSEESSPERSFTPARETPRVAEVVVIKSEVATERSHRDLLFDDTVDIVLAGPQPPTTSLAAETHQEIPEPLTTRIDEPPEVIGVEVPREMPREPLPEQEPRGTIKVEFFHAQQPVIEPPLARDERALSKPLPSRKEMDLPHPPIEMPPPVPPRVHKEEVTKTAFHVPVETFVPKEPLTNLYLDEPPLIEEVRGKDTAVDLPIDVERTSEGEQTADDNSIDGENFLTIYEDAHIEIDTTPERARVRTNEPVEVSRRLEDVLPRTPERLFVPVHTYGGRVYRHSRALIGVFALLTLVLVDR